VTGRAGPVGAGAEAPPAPLLPLRRPVVVIDTETTGCGAGHRIVSLGAVRLSAMLEPLETLHLVFNPERRSDWGAWRVHGLSDRYLARQPRFAEHAEEVAAFLGGCTVAAHNLAFDLPMLRGEYARLGREAPVAEGLCTLRAARARWPGARCGLDAVLERIGLARREGRHGAFQDAALTVGVLRWLHDLPAGCGLAPCPPMNERA
jgi:DNA polymerase III subunit epsilon